MAEDEGEDHRSIEACTTAQAMIDINAKHLDGLRTQCPPSAELTQHEIRSVESKLIKLFSRQLIAKYKCPNREALKELEQYPRLRLWLQVVGLSLKCIEGISQEIETMDELLRMSEHNLKEIMHKVNARDEEIRRMLIALRNLKTYTDRQLQGEVSTATDLELHWESWDRNSGVGTSPRSYHRTRAARSSVPSEELLKGTPVSPPSNHGHHMSSSSGHISVSSTAMYHGLSSTIPNYGSASLTPNSRECRYTPPPTPPIMGKKGDKRFPTTPPPSKKHQTTLLPEFPLTKSKSHEEHLANRIEHMDSLQNKGENIPRRRLATEPGLESSGLFGQMSPLMSSPNRSPPFISPDQQSDGCFVDEIPSQNILPVPRSPRTQGMGHSIHHRFTPTLKVTICQLCDKPMFFGVKCKECKFRYHRDCSEKAPPSCGLPNALVHFFSRTITNEGSHSPIMSHTPSVTSPNILRSESGRERKKSRQQPIINIPPFPPPDSSSNTSSCNSSTPSSPAVIITSAQQMQSSYSRIHQFHFPDVSDLNKDVTLETKPFIDSEMIETQKSNDSDKTVSGTSGSTDSEKTLAGRVDSQDSQVSDVDASERSWPRQNSLSLREWDIPYDELEIIDRLGTGRFGTVYKGNWHGSVAIKVLNMDHVDDKKTLETFKQEVATFRKTRHENLVLFMGACMNPPHLAIVTSLCKGNTLYTQIHLLKDKLSLNKTVSIAQQISQGMGYLHAREIVHKDLKTRNIFYENGKVVITDFGLFSVTKLCHGNRKGEWLTIPKGWLCYLAPEVIHSLRAGNQQEGDDLPFSTASDVYAFGTVWYELLCGEWPFQGLPSEAIIWQVGKGVKQSLANIQASRDVKEILMMCWAFKSSDRPEFSKLLTILSQLPLLPKKRLARSPSHPIHLSRSAESVF
ncbi:kinase suppressor of Ras 1-like isoform X2 [Centruroides sculpturatus]|uniref:kinase suppressor of Ras 1-like isoform X1 n=1 Tax=Centruroides sculpturatus TaxID=218467 RepID=UPI000C6E89CC|nr:kinase suppressor of Ras 1-like isoform X1 [Centruroides sculpturatus]XP_023215151.1 kinase suppressor of Ras 1-like isoform X2 [Centruroides sculpturatus]